MGECMIILRANYGGSCAIPYRTICKSREKDTKGEKWGFARKAMAVSYCSFAMRKVLDDGVVVLSAVIGYTFG